MRHLQYFTSARTRPLNLPDSWVKITYGRGIQSYVQLRDWQLVLNAAKIPYYLADYRKQSHLYTPPLYANIAKNEIEKYISENSTPKTTQISWEPNKNAWRVLLFLLPLFLLHLLSSSHFQFFHFSSTHLIERGCLDKTDIIYKNEWFRIFTSLTLHSGIKHLSGNLALGGFFLFLLARITGAGVALLLTILAGGMGNLASILIHTLNYKSVGFSTAIFATLGIMGGIMTFMDRSPKKILLPLGGVLGLLGLLGTEGDNTDYGAHLTGLFSGFITGLIYKGAKQQSSLRLPQIFCGFLALAILTISWICALK